VGGKPLLYTRITQMCVLLFLYVPELRFSTVSVRPSSGLFWTRLWIFWCHTKREFLD